MTISNNNDSWMINSSINRPVLTTGQNTKNNVQGFSSNKSSSYLILIIAPIIDAMYIIIKYNHFISVNSMNFWCIGLAIS